MFYTAVIKFGYRQILIAYFIFFIVENSISKATENVINNGSVCQTPLCREIAKTFINSMNQTTDPCNDFFEYACGNFGKNASYRNGYINYFSLMRDFTSQRIKDILESDWSPMENIALTKSKQLYKSCMDLKAIESRGLLDLVYLLNDLGTWPMATPQIKWKLREKPWQEIDLQIRKNIGISPLFVLEPSADIKNSSFNILWLTLPSSSDGSYIFAHHFLLNKQNNTNISLTSKEYRKSIVDSARLIANYNRIFVSQYSLDIDAGNVVKFELALHDIIENFTSNGTFDLTHNYHKLTINELQKKFDAKSPKTRNGKIVWLNYLRHLYSDIPDVSIDGSHEIAVVGEEYFMKLIDLLDQTPSRTIVNTMLWWLVKRLAPLTNEKLKNITITRKSDKSKRWKWCIDRNEMPHAIAHAYVQKYFPKASKLYVSNMVKEIIVGMRNDIDRSRWLDSYSKRNALKKLSLMKKFVGYPDWYEDDKALANHYENAS
ncbi:hypothetical protein PV328_006714 [Microctonus aethiopoides]|uniref:Peptidase M13 N-terminal domain-containing protein n=1 Tax=Microctonus aethiopoides TaxID=144406 RepID=A0AA39FPP3_9HYME|nr:hypothetical protein PV328_006714 [Microctonus aethiopoides]